MYKISVVMPTYNAEKYLRETIDSILGQTYSNFELLIIDDNSRDKTREIISSYKDERIRLIDGDCKGLAAALNKGIMEAQGEFIARMDADDISLPERFEKQVQFLDNHKDISLVGSWQQTFQDASFIWRPAANYKDVKCSLLFSWTFCHSTVMFRKNDFVKNNLFYDTNCIQEDYDLWVRAVKILKLANIPEVLGKYRLSADNATKTRYNKVIAHEIKMTRQQLEEYLKITVPEEDSMIIQMENNPYRTLPREERKIFQAKLYKLYMQIIKQNNKLKVYDKDYLLKILKNNWRMFCRREILIKENYFSPEYLSLFQKIFSITNNGIYKVIYLFGLKFKYKNYKAIIKRKNIAIKNLVLRKDAQIKKLTSEINKLKTADNAKNN